MTPGMATAVVSAATGAGLPELRAFLAGKLAAFVGQSGVGKSSLVNALDPSFRIRVGDVQERSGKGRHTTTGSTLLELEGGLRVIDTPGIRSFGLAHVDPEQLIEAFPDLDEMTEECPRGCTHGSGEPECCLDDALADDSVDPDRVESFRRLLAARERGHDD